MFNSTAISQTHGVHYSDAFVLFRELINESNRLSSRRSYARGSECDILNLETVNRWHQRYKANDDVHDKKAVHKFKKIDPKKLAAYMDEHPDAYLKEIALDFNCSDMSIHRALKKLGITRKKTTRYSEQN